MTPLERQQVKAGRPQRPELTVLRDLVADLRLLIPATELGDIDDVLRLVGDDSVEVTGVSLDSRRILEGDLYCALPGVRTHGINFVENAIDEGAVAIFTDQAGIDQIRPESPVFAGVPVLVADNPREWLGAVSARVYGNPALSMTMIGVTGTAGKSTTTRMIEGALSKADIRSGVIGTLGTRIAGRDIKSALTTPEAPDLHALFAVMREAGVKACAMEVSSHALVQGRVDGVGFDVAVFLNLGRDHLDFHLDIEDYYQAKALLFSQERARRAVVCIDDEYGRRVVEDTDLPVTTFSAQGNAADWEARRLELTSEGSAFELLGPRGRVRRSHTEVTVPIAGDYNVSNAVAAIVASVEAGYDLKQVVFGLAQFEGVPGRLERIEEDQDFTVLVDYAHKPDSVEALLRTVRPLTDGRVLIVLGAGGDRDPGKRELMGAVAARLADVLIVTDDNPRSEDPALIRQAVLSTTAGLRAEVREVGDRKEAIWTVLQLAEPGDIVVIAGKGHESGQEIAGKITPFDDRTVAREFLVHMRQNPAT